MDDKAVKQFSKEIASQTLVTLLGCSFFELQEKDIVLCQRHLIAHHAKKAYELKVNDKARQLHEQQLAIRK